MKAKSFSGMACSVAGAIEAIVDRWGVLILRDLMLGLRRYDQLQKSTGIPAQTLSNRLKQLEASGLVIKRRYQDKPPRDEYRLTEKGRDLWPVLTALREWGDRWEAHGAKGVPLELRDKTSGHPLRLELCDSVTGERVALEKAAPCPGPGADDAMRFRLGLTD
ncbi:helix-turn-helix transcriptional regulator [Thalassobius aquimarinus]|uniref:Helix-turn-helix transcriptional regulator n=1 Tax=Thalassovita aquimarina TaxID=2785917 RepID=A0ABS5HRS5_9RHOB|nr:helix-turn-helix transcriptional regulator [Thalassovita aquimarina]